MEISQPIHHPTPVLLGSRSELSPTTKPKFSSTALSPNYSPVGSYSPTREALSKEKWHPRMFVIPLDSIYMTQGTDAYALAALKYYNQKNGTGYEHAFDGDYHEFMFYNYPVIHLNFVAKEDSKWSMFFAEILVDTSLCEYNSHDFLRARVDLPITLIIIACLTMEPGREVGDCDKCSNVLHPQNGFLLGHKPKNLSTSLWNLKTMPTYSMQENPEFLKDVLASDEEKRPAELSRRAKIALEYYNKENSTDYELVEFLDSNGLYWEGFWLHCNFTAKSTGESPSKLFFAEIRAVIEDETTWTDNEVCIILDGKTTFGCKFCSAIIHPTHGFSQGSTNRYAPGNKLPRDLTDWQKHDRRAEIALDYFNEENDSNYELVDVLTKNQFLSNGTWYHYNFMAKQGVNDKYTLRVFFAEISVMYRPEGETLTVTTCLILEGETIASCDLCSGVIHPTYGFYKGCDSGSYLRRTSPIYSMQDPPDFLKDVLASDEEKRCDKLQRRAKIALEYYNKENSTDYELVEFLDSNGLYWEGFWLHCNFTAKSPGESSSKLFFAEIRAVNEDETIWTDNEVCVILDGITTDGCTFCSGIIHPIRGFHQGISRENMDPSDRKIPCSLPSYEKRCRRAMLALNMYNYIHGTGYELVHVILSNGFISDGIWYHINFQAKQDVEGKYTSKIFFAELLGEIDLVREEAYIATACHILEGETSACCSLCSNVIHPSQGYLKGHY